MIRPSLFTIAILLCSSAAFAQKADSSVHTLDEVVMTAQRNKQQQMLVPYSVSMLSQQQLSAFNPRTTPEALQVSPAVFVQKTNHGGGSPFVRGMTGNQLLILVDGIRFNNASFRYGPNQYLNTIDVNTIDHIEVARGTGSVQYGSDAIGGVVHIIAREPQLSAGKTTTGGRILAKYMTGDMERTIRGEIVHSAKRFAVLAGVSKRKFGDLIGGDTTGRQHPSGYDEWSFDWKTKWLLNKNMQLTVANQFLRQTNVPVYHKVVLENFAVNEMDPQQRLLGYARLGIQSSARFARKIELTTSWQQSIEGRNSRKNGSAVLRKERDEVNTIGFTSDILSVFTKAWSANSGIEIYHDHVGSSRSDINTQAGTSSSLRGLYPDDARYGNFSLYSLHRLDFQKWIIDAGLRFNIFSIHIQDTSLGKVNINPSALVANLAVMYRAGRYQTIFASLSNGFRAPNIDDMGTLGIVDFRYEIPASGLEPERSRHAEVGYKFSSKKIGATVSAFYMHLENLVTRVRLDGQVINGYPVYKKENTESAYIKGLEIEFSARWAKHWNVSAGAAYAYGDNLTKHEPLRRIPPFHGRVSAGFTKKKWFATGEWQFASRQSRLAQGDKDDNRIPAGGTPGWNLFNIVMGSELGIVRLNAGLQNIFNADYRTHGSGINGAGRSGWIAVTINM